MPDTTGQIAVSSSPAGAGVFLDNVYQGVTPVTLNDVAAGSHVITVKHDGYQTFQQTETITGGQVLPVAVALAEITPTSGKTPLSAIPVLAALMIAGAVLVMRRK